MGRDDFSKRSLVCHGNSIFGLHQDFEDKPPGLVCLIKKSVAKPMMDKINNKSPVLSTGLLLRLSNDPIGIRTRVLALRGLRPRPLDDRAIRNLNLHPASGMSSKGIWPIYLRKPVNAGVKSDFLPVCVIGVIPRACHWIQPHGCGPGDRLEGA